MQNSKFTFVNSTYMYNDCKYNLVALFMRQKPEVIVNA